MRDAAAAPAPGERLPFRLHDFTRLLWASDRARSAWEPRIARIAAAWERVERESVVAGVRPCAMQHVALDALPRLGAACIAQGLAMLPLAVEGLAEGPYTSCIVPAPDARRQAARVVVGAPANAAALAAAWHAGRHDEVGRLLGFPACCAAFFTRVWVEGQWVDTTWPMAIASRSTPAGEGVVEIECAPPANILLRWLGVRAVPHLPCSFHCAGTLRLADAMLRVARAAGYAEETDWLVDMLSWPVEWSALHGIAEIRTPIVKIASRTDATASRLVVRKTGSRYPAEGARGTVFPFVARPPAAASFVRPADPDVQDNGFRSATAMAAAHRTIVEAAAACVRTPRARVLDLGCGNGALLEALRREYDGLVVSGVDAVPARVGRARVRLPASADRLWAGDMFDPGAPWAGEEVDLVLLMPGRLLEVPPDRAELLRAWLRSRGARVLAYAYGDWLSRYGSLGELCARAGFELAGDEIGAPGCAAAPARPRAPDAA